jgi:RNA polymerase sigma-70 factor (ECF subfamily)
VSETSDEALMRAVREGDVALLGVLFERHHARIHALCYRLTRRADVADDLVQETMLRLLRYASSYRSDSAFTTWLYRLTYNVCRDHWRKTRRDDETTDLTEVQDVIARDVDDRVDERHALLEEAMERLAPERRAVLVLSRYNDLGYDDIARVLECTPATARVRAHRALNELREIYRELERRQRHVR